jgi:hypothetical protein
MRAEELTAHAELRGRLSAVLYVTAVVDLVMSALVLAFEHGSTVIDNPWDAFFWTTTQLLTVSSQMPLPTTTAGRIADIALEAYAVFVVAALAGLVTDFLKSHREQRAAGDTASSA